MPNKIILAIKKKTKPKHTLWAVLALLVLAITNIGVLAQPYSPSAVRDIGIKFARASSGEHQISYAYSGNTDKIGLLFIHGTPGGWGAFELYLENKQLQQDFFMVSVDRIGWGASPLALKDVDGNFDLQVNTINAVMESYPDKKWILIGHSLGASIAPKIALKNPNAVADLLLLAGSLKPSLGGPRWYNRAASTLVIANLIGKQMRRSNREIMGLRKQLAIMDKEIKSSQLSTRLTLMQGGKDKLVSPKNSDYVRNNWAENFASVEIIYLEEEGHFLPWRQARRVVETLYRLSARTQQFN